MEAMNGQELDGNEIEVTLAKPVDKDHRQAKAAAKAMSGMCSYPPYDYSSFGVPYNNQFFMYNAMPGGGAQQQRAPFGNGMLRPRGRGRTAAGSRAAGNKGAYYPGFASFTGYNHGYYPAVRPGWYGNGSRKGQQEERMYDLLPGMELTPTNPMTLKPHALRSAIQILEDLCQKNQWGIPAYTLHSTLGPQEVQLFLHKVSIPVVGAQYQPTKLCRSVEESKNYAAEYSLQQLGVPYEGVDMPPTTMTTIPTTAAYQPRPIPPGAYSIPNSGRPVNSTETYTTTFLPLTNSPSPVATAVVAKLGSWPAGVPQGQDGGMYGSYDGYPAEQSYQNIYQY